MAGYEIKISLRDIKPKIWRKMFVPSGLNFAEFQIMLNLGMGWHNCHLHEFEFPKTTTWVTNNKEIVEDYDSGFLEGLKAQGFPVEVKRFLLSQETEIDDFLVVGSKFYYIYDLGDYWEHEIQVVKAADDYTLRYATVTGYSGNCPPEDCGGVGGYEDFLAIISDSKHKDYKRIKAWAESQGYGDYDIDKANIMLKDWKKYFR